MPVGQHADRTMNTADVLVGAVEAPDPAGAAHVALDVDRRPVGEEVRERGRGVAGDAEGQGDDDPRLVELWVLEVCVVL